MKYQFTNRRRAKDALISYEETYNDRPEVKVYVTLDSVIIETEKQRPHDEVIFHFGEAYGDDIDLAQVQEFYQGDGIRRFRF